MSDRLRVEDIPVGANVQVLLKHQEEVYDILPGVVIELLRFESLPTAVIAVYEKSHRQINIEFVRYNAQSTDIEVLLHSDSTPYLSKYAVVASLEQTIARYTSDLEDYEHEYKRSLEVIRDKYEPGIASRRSDVAELHAKLRWFKNHFAEFFKDICEEED